MPRERHVSITLVDDSDPPWLVTSCARNECGGEDIKLVIGGLHFRWGDLEAQVIRFVRMLIHEQYAEAKGRAKEDAE